MTPQNADCKITVTVADLAKVFTQWEIDYRKQKESGVIDPRATEQTPEQLGVMRAEYIASVLLRK